ncbi:class I SAM-dependent methyltransferase [Thalassotalea sp. Y01]|uniref:class I SAM-dependent methyltransferase n=1 Tax=Thalassotalea sp. Y01 TaxID=2729613 RepID=UPI00145CA016|nr:class I SAM-dependent methyltransferase [Thalassotalea sp. Y01]NMP17565.1 class I SAM-dependent methyltransferase [Thalassotalea sp. Y01]
MSNYWSQYWQQGHLTSFGEDIKGNYSGPLKQVWQALFAPLNESHRVLDIATGNGALVSLLYDDNIQNSLPAVDAIDLAKLQIESSLLTRSETTKFYDHVNAEELPFTDDFFDLIVSQFGIEYANWNKTLVHVARCLKPGGKAQFVVHNSESTIVKPNSAILKMNIELAKRGGPIDTLKSLCQTLQKQGKGAPLAEKHRNKLNKIMNKLVQQDEYAFKATNFHMLARSCMQSISQIEQVNSLFSGFESERKGSVERLSDLINAAVDDKQKRRITQLIAVNGLKLELFEVVYNEQNLPLAWQIQLEKPLN